MVPYPGHLSEVHKFSPELILLWARRTILYLEIEHFEGQIKANEGLKDDKNPEETTKKIAAFKEALELAKAEQKIVMEKFDSIEAKIA